MLEAFSLTWELTKGKKGAISASTLVFVFNFFFIIHIIIIQLAPWPPGSTKQLLRCYWLHQRVDDGPISSTRVTRCVLQEKNPRKPYNKFFFCNNCLICRPLIGSVLPSIIVQTDEIFKLIKLSSSILSVKLSTFEPVYGLFYVANQKARKSIDNVRVILNKIQLSLFTESLPRLLPSLIPRIWPFGALVIVLRLVVPQPVWQCYDAIYHQ